MRSPGLPPHSFRRRERGYVMAMLLAMCVIMGILMQKGRVSEVAMLQRENEEELIFRGQSYARALRLYQQRFGGLPTKLEQLTKVTPPIIRRLYKDPITGGDFELVTAVQAGVTGDKTGLPIAGVRSKSNLNSIKKYNNKEIISEWVFSATEDLYGLGGKGTAGAPPPAGGTPSKGGNPPSPSPEKK